MLQGSAHGGRERFAAIYAEHKPRLVRWLVAIFGPRDAEDIAQETMIRLYLRPALLTDLADPWPWLSSVARNVGIDVVRRSAKCTVVDPSVLHDLAANEVHEPMLARDEARHLIGALARISPVERHVILLREVNGWPLADIAAMFDTNTNAMKQRLFRARRRLAGEYAALNGEPEFDGPQRGSVVGAAANDRRRPPADCICKRPTCRARSRLDAQ